MANEKYGENVGKNIIMKNVYVFGEDSALYLERALVGLGNLEIAPSEIRRGIFLLVYIVLALFGLHDETALRQLPKKSCLSEIYKSGWLRLDQCNYSGSDRAVLFNLAAG